MSYLSGNETIIGTGHQFITLELAKEDLDRVQKLKNAFVMKEAF